MADAQRFTCIVCPKGCALEAERGAEGIAVRGNACRRGEDYARAEATDPRRSLTSTVRVELSPRRRLPVRSSAEIPLARLREAARALDRIVARPPLSCGDILAHDFLGLGVDILAADDLTADKES